MLVGIADWERGGGVTQNATMVGIRGFISYAPQVLQAQVWTYIGIYDEGETIDDPDNIVTLYTENILWTYTYQGAGYDSHGHAHPRNQRQSQAQNHTGQRGLHRQSSERRERISLDVHGTRVPAVFLTNI